VLFSNRLERAINLSIAVLLVVLAGAVYWYVVRPLPETSGELTAPVAANAAISRDALGVPHIEASSWQDAIFLQGYATAQDRMWQMDALRRLAGGELAEVIGKQALTSDEEARRLRLGRIADEAERTIPEADRAAFAAYARGVNFYLETHRGKLPVEFTLLNYDPRPWRVHDSLLIGLYMYRTLTTSWRDEIDKMHMLEKGDRAKVEFLFSTRTGGEVQPGSNAWVISGAHTTTGKPILANDPHLEFSMPSTWYMVHLKAPDLDVTGVALPGVPAVIIGHNRRIAWGATNLQADVQDLYREQIDPQNGRYVFQGQILQAHLERNVIAVKGEKPVELGEWVTRHGPVFLDDEKRQYALQWTAALPQGFGFPFMDIDRARDWTEFKNAIGRYPGPGQNFVYADVDGNIGYHAAGRLPIRPENCRGDVPAEGAPGQCEWQGFIPFDDLPQSFNPALGVIVTANQNPFPPDYKYPYNGDFAAYYRSSEIRWALAKKEKWQAHDMIGIQKDVYSAFSEFLARQMVAAYDAKKNGPREAIDLLRGWSGQMEKGTAAPMIVALVYEELRKAVADCAAAGVAEEYTFPMGAPAIEKLLRERPAGWFKDYDQTLLDSLKKALAAGEEEQGSKISRWDYGQWNELRLMHPVLSQVPVVGKYFNIGPAAMSGSGTTIKQTTPRLGPSMRMAVDLANLDNSTQNITVGESGMALSRHYKDQWTAYYGATTFPMQFDRVDAKQVLRVKPSGK
jgi:penicillin G amidase